MAFFFGPSLAERSQLVQTLRRLGPTTIGALAAELGWSPRRTEKLVKGLARRRQGGIQYRPQLHRVHIGSDSAPLEPAVESSPGPNPEPRVPALPSARSGPAAPSSLAPPSHPEIAQSHSCPTCRTAMQPTRTGEAIVCPKCGRLALAPQLGTDSSAVRSAPSVPLDGRANDRRAQEMLASYVTSRPIPCPRCRSPLRHAGVAAFRCPACGESIEFAAAPSLARPRLPAAPPIPAPR